MPPRSGPLANRIFPLSKVYLHTFGVDPGRVQVRQCRLIAHTLHRLWRLVVYETARPPPPSFLSIVHGPIRGWPRARGRVGVGGEGEGTGKQEGRQIGGIVGLLCYSAETRLGKRIDLDVRRRYEADPRYPMSKDNELGSLLGIEIAKDERAVMSGATREVEYGYDFQ